MKLSPDLIWSRRQVVQIMALSVLSPPRALPTERNIHWALGAVTWVVKAEPGSPRWEDILADIAAGGFEGFEPFTTPTLPVNDENMANDFLWLEQHLQEDDYVRGQMIFGLGLNGRFWNFDLQSTTVPDRLGVFGAAHAGTV